MKRYLLLLALSLPMATMAQDEIPAAGPASIAYHEYRMKESVPPYGLAKVKALITKINDSEETTALNAKDYLGLSLREKFTYHMIHAESYSQNCDIVLPEPDEEKKIFAYLPSVFGDTHWSSRQLDFFQSNRDSVLALIKESANRSKRTGLNYKHALMEMHAVEAIPFLAEFYQRDRKDHDILTLLMLLMKESRYAPFLSSASYTKLYSKESNYFSYLQDNKANEDLIIKRATDFYNSRK
ncbi:hypothetical protein MKQ70_01665 [Chitinophaga sedimenti]|uniref:hypothetical protein n=1 Tax=Chitinophaga sedimenti TaxID=2033606 RepID=UPI00200604B3|nr:hypothetical protein [Chitinophaga sedimenti]MCK7553778.1 hypothetical protein [Chitinophaga sedimenti]